MKTQSGGSLVKLYFYYPDNSDYTIFGFECDLIIPFSQLPSIGDSINLESILTEHTFNKLKNIYLEESKIKNLPPFLGPISIPVITQRTFSYDKNRHVDIIALHATANFTFSLPKPHKNNIIIPTL